MIALLSGPEWLVTFVCGLGFGWLARVVWVGLRDLDRHGAPDFDGSQRRAAERARRWDT